MIIRTWANLGPLGIGMQHEQQPPVVALMMLRARTRATVAAMASPMDGLLG